MIHTRFALAAALSALVCESASADALSRTKLTEILRDRAVASDPERLLHAIGAQNLSLTRGEMIGALSVSGAPRQARALLSVTQSLESRGGRVRMSRLLSTRAQAPDGRVMAFDSELSYQVQGRDLLGIRGLKVADGPQGFLHHRRSARGVGPKPQPPVTQPPAAQPPAAQPPAAQPPAAQPPAAQPPAAQPPAAQPPAAQPPVPAGMGLAAALRRSLSLGDEGDEVRALQDQLNRHLPADARALDSDGKFGRKTRDALKAFQRAQGLPETGRLDLATQTALDSAQLLSRGDKGAEVVELQRLLNRDPDAALSEDEAFGPRTEAAVKAFQRGAGLPETGVADPATLSALRARDRAPAQPTLERGEEGAAVAKLQERLNAHRRASGEAPIQEDGKFGPATERALKEFQRSKGLPETGSGDSSTSAELGKAPARPSLSRGDEGQGVRDLQRKLNEHRRAAGKPAIAEDGKFGPGTERALSDFQADKGLPSSGTPDEATHEALDATPEVAPGAGPANWDTTPPAADYSRTTFRGKRVNRRTQELLERAERILADLGHPGVRFVLTQGSYSSSVSASGGTHSGGGALDIRTRGHSKARVDAMVKALRRAGFAAWSRGRGADSFPPHIHALAIGDREASGSARRQIRAYANGRSGLRSNRRDADAHVGREAPRWARSHF